MKSFSQIKSLNFGKIASKKYYQEIDFEYLGDKIIIPVQIENKNFRFILDTGAPTVIYEKTYKLLKGTKKLGKVNLSDIQNVVNEVEAISINKLKIGDLSFSDSHSLLVKMPDDNLISCFNVDGFIGSNTFRNSIIQLDLDYNKLIITNKKKKLKIRDKGSSLFLNDIQSKPFINIKIKGEKDIFSEGNVYIDTGAFDLYNMSKAIFDTIIKHKNLNIFQIVGEDSGYGGLGYSGDALKDEQVRVSIPKISINGFETKDYVSDTFTSEHSSIGLELLDFGVMTLDFKNKKFHFDPFDSIGNEKDYIGYSYGFSFNYIDNKLIIDFIWDEALKEKVSTGDELIEINEVKVANIPMCELLLGEYLTNIDTDEICAVVKSKEGILSKFKTKRTIANKI